MPRKTLPVSVTLTVIAAVIAISVYDFGAPANTTAAEPGNGSTVVPATDDSLKPVDNMHHFMEYAYEPVYKNLAAAIKTEPADKAGWAKVKSGSMILAEASILLANRVPEDEDSTETWKASSKLVHKHGSELFHAARKKDFAQVQKSFAAMSEGCKKCHEEYR